MELALDRLPPSRLGHDPTWPETVPTYIERDWPPGFPGKELKSLTINQVTYQQVVWHLFVVYRTGEGQMKRRSRSDIFGTRRGWARALHRAHGGGRPAAVI